MREMLLCKVNMSEVQGEGNVTLYCDLCLKYRKREMFLCTVI